MKLQSVQTLRGIAVLGVVLCHTLRLNVGAAGVDLFFVISGFIIAMVMRGRDAAAFAFDRFWRVYPIYILLSLPWLGTDPARLASSLTLWPVWGGFQLPYLGVAWTLCFEILFYAGATASLALGSARPILAAYFVSLAWFIVAPNPVVAFIGNPLVLEFLAGVAIFHAPRKPLLGGVMLLGGIMLFACTNIFELNGITGRYQTAGMAGFRLLFWGIPAALTVYGVVSLEPWVRWRSRIGDASYSIYLIHPAVVVWLNWPWPGEFVGSVVAGLLIHRLIEKRLLSAKPQFRIWRRRAAEPLVPPPIADLSIDGRPPNIRQGL